MANEFAISGSLSCFKPSIMSSTVARAIASLARTMSGTTYIQAEMSVPTSATVIPLGGVTSPHWAWFYNTDATNYLQLQNGASGAVFCRLLAGDFALVPLDPAAVPYAIANTANCLMEYTIFAT